MPICLDWSSCLWLLITASCLQLLGASGDVLSNWVLTILLWFPGLGFGHSLSWAVVSTQGVTQQMGALSLKLENNNNNYVLAGSWAQ